MELARSGLGEALKGGDRKIFVCNHMPSPECGRARRTGWPCGTSSPCRPSLGGGGWRVRACDLGTSVLSQARSLFFLVSSSAFSTNDPPEQPLMTLPHAPMNQKPLLEGIPDKLDKRHWRLAEPTSTI